MPNYELISPPHLLAVGGRTQTVSTASIWYDRESNEQSGNDEKGLFSQDIRITDKKDGLKLPKQNYALNVIHSTIQIMIIIIPFILLLAQCTRFSQNGNHFAVFVINLMFILMLYLFPPL